jgi:hypothetical protein
VVELVSLCVVMYWGYYCAVCVCADPTLRTYVCALHFKTTTPYKHMCVLYCTYVEFNFIFF